MKSKAENYITVEFPSRSANEGFARAVVACFVAQMDPTLNELEDIKTAVSEAVTNAIVHGYRNTKGTVEMIMRLYEGNLVQIIIKDKGCGILDVKAAMEPEFSTAPPEEERSGLGFTVMESFMDKVRVRSAEGKGTAVVLEKTLIGK